MWSKAANLWSNAAGLWSKVVRLWSKAAGLWSKAMRLRSNAALLWSNDANHGVIVLKSDEHHAAI